MDSPDDLSQPTSEQLNELHSVEPEPPNEFISGPRQPAAVATSSSDLQPINEESSSAAGTGFAHAFRNVALPPPDAQSMELDEEEENAHTFTVARPPPRPMDAFIYVHPNTLITGQNNGVAFSALTWSTVKQTERMRTPIVVTTGNIRIVAASLFVPCMRRSDPVTMSHDIGMVSSFGNKRNNASLKLWFSERLTVLLSLPRIMNTFPDSTAYSAINMLKDVQRYNSETVGTIIMVNFRGPIRDLNAHLQENANLFKGKSHPKFNQPQVAAIVAAMCMSVTSIRTAMVLRRDLGSLTIHGNYDSQAAFPYLPGEWRSVIHSKNAVRHGVLRHFESIYSLRCQSTNWSEHWTPTEFAIDPMHGLTSLSFQEWFREHNIRHMNNGHSLAKGFCSMMAVVGQSVYKFPFTTHVFSEQSLLQQALGEVQEYQINAMMDASSVLDASLREAHVFGADASQNIDFYFREAGTEYGYSNEATAAMPNQSALFVSPYLFIPQDALMACCGNQSDDVIERALEATKSYITGSHTEKATASLTVAVIPPAFAYANCIFDRSLQLFGPASRDHYIKGFESVINSSDGDAQHFVLAVETSWSNAVDTIRIGADDKGLLSHPLTTMQAGVLQHNLLDTATVLDTLARSRNARMGLNARDRVFSLISGPLSVVTHYSAASAITDTIKSNMAIGSNNIPWWISLMEMDELSDVDAATIQLAIARVAETLTENSTSNWEMMRSVAARYGYRKGAITTTIQHASVAYCELLDSVELAPTTDWITIQQSHTHNRELPAVIRQRKLPPHLVLPEHTLPMYSDMIAGTVFVKEIIDAIHDSNRGVGLYGCGERAVFIRLAQLTALFHVNMAAHVFTSGVTTTGKSATVQSCAGMGLKGLAITVDNQTAGATDTRNEDRMHRIIIMEEVGLDIVGKENTMFASSKMGANAGSERQTAMLRVLEHGETTRFLKERIEIKTSTLTTSTFKVVPSKSNQQCSITTTSNIEGTAIAAPIVARMWMCFFTATKPSGLPPAKLNRIGSTVAARMCDVVGLAIVKYQMGARVGEYPPVDYSAVAEAISLIADECEKAFAGGQRHAIASLPFCVTPLVARVSVHKPTQLNGDSSSSNVIYSRERLKDQLCTLFTQLATLIRLTTVISWLSTLITLAPRIERVPLDQAIMQVYGIAGPEDVIFSTFMLGTFDTLLVASDNTRLARVFAAPCVQAFILALAMYTYGVRWCLDQYTHPDDTPDQRRSRIGPSPRLAVVSTLSEDERKAITPTNLLEAVVDMDSPLTLFHQLLRMPIDFFFQPDMMWLVNIAARFSARVCTLMHPSKVRYPKERTPLEVHRTIAGPLPITPLRMVNTPVHTPGTPAFTLRNQIQSPATNRFSLFTSKPKPADVESKEATNFATFFSSSALTPTPVLDTAASSSSAEPAIQFGLSMLNESTRDSAAASADTHHESLCITMARVLSDASQLLLDAAELWGRTTASHPTNDQERNLVTLGEQLQSRVSQPNVMYVVPTQNADPTPCLLHHQLQSLWLHSGEYLYTQVIDSEQVITAFNAGPALPPFVQFMHDADQRDMTSNMPSRSAAEEKLMDLDHWPTAPPQEKSHPPPSSQPTQQGMSSVHQGRAYPIWRAGMARFQPATQAGSFTPASATSSSSSSSEDHIERALNALMNAHDGQNVMKLTDLVPQKLAYVVTNSIAQNCGYTIPTGCAVVILKPTQLYGSKTTTERGLENAMHIMAQPSYKGPRIFTYPFNGHVPSNEGDGVVRLKRIEAIHEHGECSMTFEPQSSAATTDRMTKAIEIGPLDESDKLSRRVDGIRDSVQFILEKRKLAMPGTATFVERELRDALSIYSTQLDPHQDAGFHAQRSALWWPQLEMCFMQSPSAIKFITEELKLIDPTRLKTYSETHQRQVTHSHAVSASSIFSSKGQRMQNIMQQMTMDALSENQRKMQNAKTGSSAKSIVERISRPKHTLEMSQFVRLNAAARKAIQTSAETAVEDVVVDTELGSAVGDDDDKRSDVGVPMRLNFDASVLPQSGPMDDEGGSDGRKRKAVSESESVGERSKKKKKKKKKEKKEKKEKSRKLRRIHDSDGEAEVEMGEERADEDVEVEMGKKRADEDVEVEIHRESAD